MGPYPAATYISTSAPTPQSLYNDLGIFKEGQFWLNTATGDVFILISILAVPGGFLTANWELVTTPGAGGVDTLTGNSGVAIPVLANINVTSSFPLLTFTGSLGNLILSGTSSMYPITPFVVGPSGSAGYQTISSAISAATVAGGGIIYIQPGIYTENLTLPGNIGLVGTPASSNSQTSDNTVTIIGTHYPPNTGSISFSNIAFQGPAPIFYSNSAGSASLQFDNCLINLTAHGYFLDLQNWVGTISVYEVLDVSENDGFLNNATGTAVCLFLSSTLGGGTQNTMMTAGSVEMEDIYLNCPANFGGSSLFYADYCEYAYPITLSGAIPAEVSWCRFSPTEGTPLTMSSSAPAQFLYCVFATNTPPSVAGSGDGTLEFSNCTFTGSQITSGGQVISTALTVASPGSSYSRSSLYIEISTPVNVAQPNTSYFVDCPNPSVFLLPVTSLLSDGDTFQFTLTNSQTVAASCGASQFIQLGGAGPTSGSIHSDIQGNSLTLTFRVIDQTFYTTSVIGTWTLS